MHKGIRDAQNYISHPRSYDFYSQNNHFSLPDRHLYPFAVKYGSFPSIAEEFSLPLPLYFLARWLIT